MKAEINKSTIPNNEELKKSLRFILTNACERFWQSGYGLTTVKLPYYNKYIQRPAKAPPKSKILFTSEQVQSVIDFFNNPMFSTMTHQDEELANLVNQFREKWLLAFYKNMKRLKKDTKRNERLHRVRLKETKAFNKKKAELKKAEEDRKYLTFKAEQDKIEDALKLKEAEEKKKILLEKLNLSEDQKKIFNKLSEI